jgi:hypothetical protein
VKLGDVQYLTVQDVLEVHRAVLFEGEAEGVLKPAELDAAVMAVQATYMGVCRRQALEAGENYVTVATMY